VILILAFALASPLILVICFLLEAFCLGIILGLSYFGASSTFRTNRILRGAMH